jgi:hypothetical protein
VSQHRSELVEKQGESMRCATRETTILSPTDCEMVSVYTRWETTFLEMRSLEPTHRFELDTIRSGAARDLLQRD